MPNTFTAMGENRNVHQHNRRPRRRADRRAGRGLLQLSLIGGLALGGTAATAQSPVACHPDQALRIADAPVDLGSGIVYQYLYPGSGGAVDGVVLFSECASGLKIAVALPELTDGSRRTPDEVALIMQTAIESEDTFTVDDLLAAFNAAGAPAQPRRSTREACACALYYPELRGEQEPWVAP